ncbi:MAG TPA: glucose-6-phosphate isomerase [Chlamydiales bacterium]|jgi:glucose-6-phosphate isomerase|nr:glucose-6-phosphate isomerase [Chlamydiales bacterium]
MASFDRFSAVKKLHVLASTPFDLSKPGALTPERLEKYSAQALGFTLLYGTERVDLAVLEELLKLAEEASVKEKMAAMQGGAVINRIQGYPSEERSVLHTAMRDVFDHRQTSAAARAASDAAEKELKKLEAFLAKLEGRYTDFIQIGIGGSDLGPKALCLALVPFHLPGRRMHFISNVDPDDANDVLSKVDLKRTLVAVVSKSGTTLETRTNEEFVRTRMMKMGLDPKEHFVAVTGEKSPMDDPSRYLASFYIWDFVGGRYSASSMVGGVCLGFALGFQRFREILKGAHDMDFHAATAAPEKNLPLLSALLGIWNRNFLQLPTVAIIPYSQALHRFPAHLQQLDMESNGKRIDQRGQPVDFSTGPIIWGEPGTNGQHSFYQLIHQGTDPIPLEFIGFKKGQYGMDLEIQNTMSQEKLLANLFAQSIALAVGQRDPNPNKFFPGNRPNRILLADRLDPYTLGSLLSYYENKVAFQGFIWGINSFDQEGVQLGKKLANQILALYQSKRTGEKAPAFPLGEAYLKILERDTSSRH